MGVTGLWTVAQPCARPIKIETLNKKRLAVDASIWIYQFLKAVRDKEGNALRNSHVVGFFRRICKLLFIGIKPVFVFDGGAPSLKRQTISARKQRREGRREDAVRTAGKLLALQMQRRAEEEEQRRKEEADFARPPPQEEPVPENPLYAAELGMTPEERQRNRRFRKKDQYHLPELDVPLSQMGGPSDPRVMSVEELEEYARQFNAGEEINVYDFSKIDFDSPFFQSLPATDRYNILNAARLRSRLRMGYSKDQLDNMFPDRMAFSRFQIDRVKERNELTQRLMHINGMTDEIPGVNMNQRVAGEKGREYVLVKNEGAEGGWALGVIGNRDEEEGQRNKPIDVDISFDDNRTEAENEWEDEDGFEDVPIEGLNRLPKAMTDGTSLADRAVNALSSEGLNDKRKALYASRKAQAQTQNQESTHTITKSRRDDTDSLFLPGEANPAENFVDMGEMEIDDEDEELKQAIALSLEPNDLPSSPSDNDFEEVFGHGPGDNTRKNAEAKHFNSDAKNAESDDDDMTLSLDFENQNKQQMNPNLTQVSASGPSRPIPEASSQPQSKFDGPLPFESLDLGSSILGKKRREKIAEESAGGFQKEAEKEQEKDKPKPVPPWFKGELEEDIETQKAIMKEDRQKEKLEAAALEEFDITSRPKMRLKESKTIIDVDADPIKSRDAIEIESSDGEQTLEIQTEKKPIVENAELLMDDIADKARAEPPVPSRVNDSVVQPELAASAEPADAKNFDSTVRREPDLRVPAKTDEDSEEEDFEWEASDNEEQAATRTASEELLEKPAGGFQDPPLSRSQSLDFQMVDIPEQSGPGRPRSATPPIAADSEAQQPPTIEASNTVSDPGPHAAEDEGYVSDSDESLLVQMAAEAEEHARFANQLTNQPSTLQAGIAEYERELKSLRSQQKRDRRDADEISQVMIEECQQLLRLFGLPYITAPMEAEAQCAELVRLQLVDGIVTDDSDIFLFGGTRVYKNMFNAAKFVECYLAADLTREFDLDRPRLIRIAHLLGSDYTEGLSGVGPVTALEILSEFPDGLDAFRDWWTAAQLSGAPASSDTSAFRRKFRKANGTKLFLPQNFPDPRVDAAYLNPEVDSDPQPLQWGVPDLGALRRFLMATIGWSDERTDEVLVPVIKDMNRREVEGTQSNITSWVGGGAGTGTVRPMGLSALNAATGGGGRRGDVGVNPEPVGEVFAPHRRQEGKSKRMETALSRMAARARRKRDGGAEEGGASEDEAVGAQNGNGISEDTRRKPRTGNGGGKRKKRAQEMDGDSDGHEEDANTAGSAAVSSASEGSSAVKAPKKRQRAARTRKKAQAD